jgi:hypothetical protein
MFTLVVAALVIFAGAALELLASRIVALPLGLRLIAGAIVVMIPGFFMGIPFPSGLALVKETEPRYTPWAWGINAVFTVVGTVLALLLAIGLGFRSVLLLASVLYLAAGLSLRALRAGGNDQIAAPTSTAVIS